MLVYFKQSPSGLIIMILINCMLMMFPRLFFLFYLILLLTWIHHNLILRGSNKSRLIFSICGVPVLHFHHSMIGSLLFDGRWRLWDTLPSFKQLFFNVRWVTWFLIFLSLIFLLIILIRYYFLNEQNTIMNFQIYFTHFIFLLTFNLRQIIFSF